MTEPEWMDEEAGPLVRPYALTRGRVHSAAGELDLIATVTATGEPGDVPLTPEQAKILRLAVRSASVVDIASEMDLPIGVVRVLLGDLQEQGLIRVRPPAQSGPRPTERILKEVINGLRAL